MTSPEAQWKPNVTVSAVVCRDERFLLVEEDADGEIVFNQPSGHLERGETLLAAVRREVLEETGWEFQPESIIGVYLYPKPGSEITYLRFCFYGHCIGHDPGGTPEPGIIRVVWLLRDEVERLGSRLRSPMVLRCIDDYLAGKSFSLDLINPMIDAQTRDRLAS